MGINLLGAAFSFSVLKNFAKIHREIPVLESLFWNPGPSSGSYKFTLVHPSIDLSVTPFFQDRQMTFFQFFTWRQGLRNTKQKFLTCPKSTLLSVRFFWTCTWRRHQKVVENDSRVFLGKILIIGRWIGALTLSLFAKTASKKIGALICSMKFLSPEVALYLYKSTLRPYMEYCLLSCLGWCSSVLLGNNR